MSKLGFGLNVAKKPTSTKAPLTAKRKGTIFNNSDSEGDEPTGPSSSDKNVKSISSLDDVQTTTTEPSDSTKSSRSKLKIGAPPTKPLKPSTTTANGNLASKFTSSKHSKTAQELDPSIYDYDGVFDSLHAAPSLSSSKKDEIDPATGEKKPRYMKSLLAAAEIRKRDQLRAKEKLLAKEREAEGDEFADKEKFVTGAYKRQQEEMRKAEEAEKEREREAEERRKREGGGMKQLYKSILERDEQRHLHVIKAVEENKGKEKPTAGSDTAGAEEGEEGLKKVKTEADLAREKGALVNEDGEVVDKRQLLSAGLNAGAPPKARKMAAQRPERMPPRNESARDRETRLFEEQLLGKRGASSDEEDDQGGQKRAGKSQKLEDELLARLGSP